jgi:CRISPR-associated protein Cmr2
MKMWERKMNEDIFILKTACLFHDPPTKAWDIAKGKSHEEQAKNIIENSLKDTILEKAKDYLNKRSVIQSDRLSSAIDRWLLSILVGKDYSKFPCQEIKIKNIFNPKFSQTIEKEPTNKEVEKFTNKLNEILKQVKDLRLAYHILYASYESLWIESNLPVSPADTRTPLHSVFDHNYAAASMVNWLTEGEKLKGILLFIDLGGPQRFISYSRKLSDLWISSYFASALAWRIFWIFIKALGPDVMILPTCRGNPFYYHSLISELIKNKVNENIVKKIKELASKILDYDPDRDKIPKYAVVPVTATFILPDLEVLKKIDDFKEIDFTKGIKGLEEFVEKKYRKIWEEIYNRIIEIHEGDKEVQNILGKLSKSAEELLKECKQFGFDKVPPLPIRVLALHTDKIHKLGLSYEEEAQYSLYHYMFKLLGYEANRRKFYKFRSEEELKLFYMTSQHVKTWPKETAKGFEYCSVCGILPAILIFPSDEKEYSSYLDIELESLFSLGERLCPYCLIKRLLTRSEILKPIMDMLLGEISRELPICKFPSVSDITLIPFKKSFINKAMKIDDDKNLVNQFNQLFDKIFEIFKLLKKIPPVKLEPVIYVEKKLEENIEKLKSDELKLRLKQILFMDSELCFLRTYMVKKEGKVETYNMRTEWSRIIEKIRKNENMKKCMELEKEEIEKLNTFYSLIKCDADNIGKIIQGKVEEGFRIDVKSYLYEALEGDVKKLIKSIMNNNREETKSICEQQGLKDIDEKIDKILKTLSKFKGEIIISPCYHSALSRALMNNAIRDTKIIDENDGLTIYAGGDDLLAVVPVKNSLIVTKKLRKTFSFPSEYKGFDKKMDYLMPSLVTASRSFSIYFAHYMFPMYIVINRSVKLLESVKETKWNINGKEMKKDGIILSYSPRGGELSSILPLCNIKETEEDVAKTLEDIIELNLDIEKGRFSSSLVRDLFDNLEIIKLLLESEVPLKILLLEKLLKRIFERNCEIRDEFQRVQMVNQWTKKLIEYYDISCEVNDKHSSLIEQFILALMHYRTGLRGV